MLGALLVLLHQPNSHVEADYPPKAHKRSLSPGLPCFKLHSQLCVLSLQDQEMTK